MQNTSKFSYKTHVQIVIASMTLYNYIRRKSEQDEVFTEFDHHSNFVSRDIFNDVVPHLQIYRGNKPSRMNYICDEITSNLIGQ